MMRQSSQRILKKSSGTEILTRNFASANVQQTKGKLLNFEMRYLVINLVEEEDGPERF